MKLSCSCVNASVLISAYLLIELPNYNAETDTTGCVCNAKQPLTLYSCSIRLSTGGINLKNNHSSWCRQLLFTFEVEITTSKVPNFTDERRYSMLKLVKFGGQVFPRQAQEAISLLYVQSSVVSRSILQVNEN